MRGAFAFLFALATLSSITACPVHDTTLDDAISQYTDRRRAEVEAACECYQLFLNPNDVDQGKFTSTEECLEILWPAAEDDVAECMKSVLDAGGHVTEASIDVVSCYTVEIDRTTDCYAQNAGECSQSACSSDVTVADQCRGQLTPAEADALYYCAVR